VSRLGYLAGGVSAADFKPTDQQVEVQKMLAEQVRARAAEFDALATTDVAAFNDLLRSRGIGHIVAR